MRKPIFDAIKQARGGKPFMVDDVREIDAFLDRMGVPSDSVLVEPPDTSLAKAVESIKRWEGCRLTAYPDPGTGGVPWTIGWGSTRDEQGQAVKPGTSWTQERADGRLAVEVAHFAKGVDAAIGAAPTTDAQRAALISFAYNVGVQALKESTLLRKHKEGDHEGAAQQFMRWTKAGGRELAGLVKRRDAESRLYRGLA